MAQKKPLPNFKFNDESGTYKTSKYQTDPSLSAIVFQDPEEIAPAGFPGVNKEKLKDNSPAAWEVINAVFQDNFSPFISYNFPDELTQDITPENFNPIDDLAGYEEYENTFAMLSNPTEVNRLKYIIDQERKNKQTIAEGGWVATAAGLAAGLLDPVNLLPLGAGAQTLKAGSSILKSGLVTARANLLASSISETILHTDQMTRELGESAANVAGATLLGGVLGSASASIGKYKKGQTFENLTQQFEKEMVIPENGSNYLGGDKIAVSKAELEAETSLTRSLSSAAVNQTEAKLKSMYGAENLALNPVVRMATSTDIEARRAVQQLADTGLQYQDNALGIASPMPIDVIVNSTRNQELANFYNLNQTAYTSYRAKESKLPVEQRAQIPDAYGIAAKDRLLNEDEFNREVFKATYNNGNHPIAEIRESAQRFRGLLDKYRDQAIEAGLLSKSVKDLKNYVPHYWDREKILANPDDFLDMAENALRKDNPNLALDSTELRSIAEDTMNRILWGDPETVRYGVIKITERGSLKDRTFNVSNEIAEPFLITDTNRVIKKYLDDLIPDIVMKTETGDVNGLTTKAKIIDSYRSKIRQVNRQDPNLVARRQSLLENLERDHQEALSSSKTAAERKRIKSRFEEEKAFIEAATPNEVLSRRNALKDLDGSFEKKLEDFRKRTWELEKQKIQKDFNARLQKEFGSIKDKALLALPEEARLKRFLQTTKIINLQTKLDKQLESINQQLQTVGAFPKLSEKLAARLKRLEENYNSSREAILKSKPKRVETIERLEASRTAELSRLNKADPSYSQKSYEINMRYNKRIIALETVDPKAAKAVKKLINTMQRDLTDYDAMVSLIRGTYNLNSGNILNKTVSAKFVKGFKTLNYVRLLGGAGISAVTDVGGTIMVSGLNNTIGSTVGALIKNIDEVFSKLFKATKTGLLKERRTELNDLGITCERLLQNRFESMTDLNAEYTSSLFDQVNRKVANLGSKLSLINYIYDSIKAMGAYAGAAKILRAATKNQLSAKEIEVFASYGFNNDMMKRIGDQFNKYGKKERGVYVAGVAQWEDREAARFFRIGLNRIVNNSVINPKLEAPLFFQSELGSLLGQFKKWSFAAYQRYFLAGLQRKDSEVFQGITAMVGLGIFNQCIRDLLDKGELKERDNLEWLSIGVERSGVLGYLPDIYNIANNFTSGAVSRGLGLAKEGDFYTKDKAISTLSPTIGLASNAVSALSWSFNPEAKLNSSTLYSIRQMLPYQNSLLLRKGFDFIEDQLRNSYGIDPRGHRSSKKVTY